MLSGKLTLWPLTTTTTKYQCYKLQYHIPFSHRCADRQPCFNVVSLYFPQDTKLPKNQAQFSSLLRDIMESQYNLEQENPLVIQIYSVVCALGIALNLCLLYCMHDTQYWSTTAVFLTIIVVQNLLESIALLVNVLRLRNGYATYSASDDTWTRKMNQFQHLLWSFSCIMIMLLVAVDRWIALNTRSGYLFMNYRKTKVCCSLAATVVLVAVINHILPLTVDIMLRDEKVQVFICITYLCHGSSLLTHKWRWHKDMRADINMVSY